MNEGVGSVVGAERPNVRELLESVGIFDGVDMDFFESCGNERRSDGPAGESGTKLVVGAESKGRERLREAAGERSRIGIAVGVEPAD